MGTKLDKNNYPKGHASSDFECFGPAATKDGEFDACKIADLGCFTQEGKDSNKYYHGSVIKSKKNSKWYVYFEYGRTGSAIPQFQFVECSDESDAQYEFAKQLHSKNDKRGEWVDLAGRRVLRAKKGEDCYLVRPMATRATGLPDARKIAMNDGGKKIVISSTPKNTSQKFDPQTIQLMKDMNVGTISYTKSQIEGGAIPTQSSIDEARDVLTEAQKRLSKIGHDIKDQIKDKQLKELTYHLYSRVPKVKTVGSDESTWILSSANIKDWMFDLDAYENALYAQNINPSSDDSIMDGFDIDMKWIDPDDEIGKFIHKWMPSATRNKHGGIGKLKIHNIWSVKQNKFVDKFQAEVESIGKEIDIKKILEFPLHQPNERPDLSDDVARKFKKSNVNMLFHGTRSVNVPGILREGLRLPKQLVGVVITGSLFGPGSYWADDWKKSVGYTSHKQSYYASGGGSVRNRESFMFVGDIVLGNPHTAKSSHGYTSAPRGCHSVFGKAGHSDMGYRDFLKNNEWIVYSISQSRLKYLVEFSC